MPLRLQRRIDRPWRFLAIAIVLVIVVLFYVDLRAVQNDTKRLDSARALQQQADRLISSVTAAETAQRGFLLTGNPVFLTSYKSAAGEIPGELDDLSRIAASPEHHRAGPSHTAADQKQIASIRMFTEQKMADLQHSIDVRDSEGPEAAADIVRMDDGRLVMDQLQSAAKVLNSGESLGLYQLQTDSRREANWSRFIVLAGSLSLVFLLFRMGSAIDSVVNEREKMALEIDDARKLLETTLGSIGDAVIVVSASGAIRFMNPVAEKLTGWKMMNSLETPLNGVFAMVDENTGKEADDPFRLLQLSSSKGVPEQLLLVSRDGSRKPIENTSAPIRDAAGKILGLVLVFRDVTARRSAERDLKRWKETFSSAGFGMFLADTKNGTIIDLNPTFASMHGYSVNELLGNGLQALVPKDSVRKLSESLQAAVEKGRNMFEVPHIRRDGSEFLAFVDVTRFNVGRAEYLAGYCSDITERKRFEDAIRESEERFRTLASALPQLIWSTDAEGRIDYVNQLWMTYAGWSSEDRARQYLPQAPWQDLLHPEDCIEYFERWRSCLRTGNTFEVQVRLRRASDSTYRWFLCRAVPVPDRSGRTIRWLGGCTEIQQQMEDAAQLKAAIQALQRSNSDLEQFAYAASHDLQEPLRMVSIYSQLLKEEYRGQLDRQAASYIDFAVSGAQRMAHLLKALLTYSRVANATPTASLETDATVAANAALMNLSSVVQETQARIEIGPLPTVRISEVHLVQLFQNLVGNALKYRREGTDAERPIVSIIAKPDAAGKWVFSITDNGMGIEPEYLTQIFGIFKRLHGSSIEGTGIGLALCQKIVERAGGRIWAESEPGKGSTFFFTLQGVEIGDHALAYHNFAGRG
jgi:PAS domain S-box-containing protein